MPAAAIPADEAERLAVLNSYALLDRACETAFDNIAHLAARLTGAAISFVSLVDAKELVANFAKLTLLRSAYDEWRGPAIERNRTFGARVNVPVGRRGTREPIYTSYTHYWKVTLGRECFKFLAQRVVT